MIDVEGGSLICQWCEKRIDALKVYLGEEEIFMIGLPLEENLFFLEAQGSVGSIKLVLCQKEMSFWVCAPGQEPPGEGINAVTLICSRECQDDLKRALYEERYGKN